jgi:hypothetical protein
MIAHQVALRGPVPFLLGLTLGAAVLVGGGFAEHRANVLGFNDFSTVWAAARTVVEGRDPYLRADWQDTLSRYPVQRNIEPFFTYPPWVTLALVPLGTLPLGVASEIWTYGGILVAALGLYGLLAHVAPARPVAHTLAGLCLLASQPGIATYWSGQWGFVLTGAVAAASASALRGGTAGTLATVALYGKPHLFPFAMWAFAAAHARARRWAELAVVVLLPAVVAVPALLARPRFLEEVLSERGAARYSAVHTPSTVAHALDDVALPGALLTAALLLVAVAAALRWDPRTAEGLAVWIALSISFAVYAWSYDHVVLVVPLVLALARRGTRLVALGSGCFLLVPTLLYTVATARDNESFSAIVPLAVLLLCMGIAIASRPAASRPRS